MTRPSWPSWLWCWWRGDDDAQEREAAERAEAVMHAAGRLLDEISGQVAAIERRERGMSGGGQRG